MECDIPDSYLHEFEITAANSLRTALHPFVAAIARKYCRMLETLEVTSEPVTVNRADVLKVMEESKGRLSEHESALAAGWRKIEIKKQADEYAVIAIAFAQMALEAYIYDYGARRLGESFHHNHLDRLSLKQKWIRFPLLVTSKRLSDDSEGLRLLDSLIAARNRYVHFQSKPVGSARNLVSEVEKDSNPAERARQGVRAIECLAHELEELDPSEKRHLLLLTRDVETETRLIITEVNGRKKILKGRRPHFHKPEQGQDA